MYAFLTAVITSVLASLVLGIATLLVKYRRLAEFRLLPGPRPNFLFGNAWNLPTHSEGMLKQVLKWANDYTSEGFYCLWLGPGHPYLLTFKPELAEVILNSSKHTTKSADYWFLIPWLGTGLLLSDGSKWRMRRKLITPTFHFRILNDFIKVFEEQAKILVSRLQRKVNQGVFNIMPYISLCTLDIICITSMDSSPNAQENSNSPYVNAVLRITGLIHKRHRSPWLWNDVLYSWTPSGREHDECLQIIHGFTNKVIDERIAERAAKKTHSQEQKQEDDAEESEFRKRKFLAFLDLLLDAYDNGEISREGIREEVDTFMFEGHDTTAAGITWALYCLGRNPAIQKRVQEEVDLFFDEYFVPKGSTVGVSPIALHRNPEVWPAPLQFDPDRFLPEKSPERHPFAFIPFSAGPRNCIGQRFALLEEKVVLSYLMRNFSVASKQTFDELLPCGELITRPKDGIFVTLVERNRKA
ncbi:PREDICTED: cytochrome P450 4V2-like [Acropora digitifera]|uniref:cytochrome P450 4V2-like n=1 Tax=Acropora digitifera TaxID=70779 RepID=UPI00077A8B2D|nr:PREDICTED: cytochrome P450 4V2-like [Acropora digitifera]